MSALSALEQLGIISGWRAKDVVLIMWNFLDEAGEFDRESKLVRLTLGGFFAPWDSIQALCEDWRLALREENLGDFHMKEIATNEEHFGEWPIERQKRLDRFVDILGKHAQILCGYSYAISPNVDRGFRDAYETAIGRAMIRASQISVEHGSRCQIVFAKTQEIGRSYVGECFDKLQWGDFLGGYAVQVSKCNPALQAAEIVARGVKRKMQDGLILHSFARVIEIVKHREFWPPML